MDTSVYRLTATLFLLVGETGFIHFLSRNVPQCAISKMYFRILTFSILERPSRDFCVNSLRHITTKVQTRKELNRKDYAYHEISRKMKTGQFQDLFRVWYSYACYFE